MGIPRDQYHEDWKLRLEKGFKFAQNFSPGIQRNVVYNLLCSECPSAYVDETGRQFATRMKEHQIARQARGRENPSGPSLPHNRLCV